MLTIVGIAGVVITAISAAKAAPKAQEALEEAETDNQEELTTIEKIKVVAPIYAKTAIFALATAASISGSTILGRKSQASLIGAYTFLNESYKRYQNGVKEIYGDEGDQAIKANIRKNSYDKIDHAKKQYLHAGGLSLDCELEEEEHVFYDEYSRRFFTSTIGRVLQAEYHTLRNHAMYNPETSVNNFYDFLGIEGIPGGNDIGWWYLWDDELLIGFDNSKEFIDDGPDHEPIECVVIRFEFEPELDKDMLE